MTAGRGFRVFEFLVVSVIIGVLVLVAINRYEALGRETRRLGFELLAHNFTAAVAGVRAHWFIQGQPKVTSVDGEQILMSTTGWPSGIVTRAATRALVTQRANTNLNANQKQVEICWQLWETLLQNPSPTTLEGQQQRGEQRYHISWVENEFCRYELVTKRLNSHYFDYSPKTGQVLLHVPVQKEISTL